MQRCAAIFIFSIDIGFISQKQIDIGSGKTHEQIRVLKVGMGCLAVRDDIGQVKAGKPEHAI